MSETKEYLITDAIFWKPLYCISVFIIDGAIYWSSGETLLASVPIYLGTQQGPHQVEQNYRIGIR